MRLWPVSVAAWVPAAIGLYYGGSAWRLGAFVSLALYLVILNVVSGEVL